MNASLGCRPRLWRITARNASVRGNDSCSTRRNRSGWLHPPAAPFGERDNYWPVDKRSVRRECGRKHASAKARCFLLSLAAFGHCVDTCWCRDFRRVFLLLQALPRSDMGVGIGDLCRRCPSPSDSSSSQEAWRVARCAHSWRSESSWRHCVCRQFDFVRSILGLRRHKTWSVFHGCLCTLPSSNFEHHHSTLGPSSLRQCQALPEACCWS